MPFLYGAYRSSDMLIIRCDHSSSSTQNDGVVDTKPLQNILKRFLDTEQQQQQQREQVQQYSEEKPCIRRLGLVHFPWQEVDDLQMLQECLKQNQFYSVTINEEYDESIFSIIPPTFDWCQVQVLSFFHMNGPSLSFPLGKYVHKFQVVGSIINETSGADLARVLVDHSSSCQQQQEAEQLEEEEEEEGQFRLQQLVLSNTAFVDNAFEIMAQGGIYHHPTLECLDLTWCRLPDEDTARLIRNAPPHLKELKLASNDVGYQSMEELSKLLSWQPATPTTTTITTPATGLHTLILRNCQTNPTDKWDLIEFCNALRFNTSLRYLDLASNHLDDKDIQMMIESVLIAKKNKLRVLDLDDNPLTNTSLYLLASHLQDIQLQELGISSPHKDFGIQGLEQIAEAMPRNRTLETLRFSPWKVGVGPSQDEEGKGDGKGQYTQEQIDYYLNLNWGGTWRLLDQNYENSSNSSSNNNNNDTKNSNRPEFPLGLWSVVLERSNDLCHKRHNLSSPDLIYRFICDGPLLK